MHELSIASAIFQRMQAHTPAGTQVRSVRLLIGPMQGIDPDSLRFGWEALCRQAGLTPPQLEMDLPGWKLICPHCSRRWESKELYATCACGCATPTVEGGAELQLISLEVVDEQSQ